MFAMNDISDLADLQFEDLAQADLCDLLQFEVAEVKKEHRRPSSPLLMDEEEEAYTHITLINGEKICLKEEGGGGGEDDCRQDNSQDMDLNSVLQAGVVERVAPAGSPVSSTSNLDYLNDLDWDIDFTPPKLDIKPVKSYVKSRPTILASQLPQPVLASSRIFDKSVPLNARQTSTVIISSSDISSEIKNNNITTSNVNINNNNNSLLRSALTGKSSILVSEAKPTEVRKALLTTVGSGGEKQVEDIFLLSLEGRDAIARLKDGASQLFPNTRVTSEPSKEAPNVISIEVDVSGNLVLHKSNLVNSNAIKDAASSLLSSHIAKVRKYHRRPREEPKKESRLLHYCHICNKGFKDKYSVNVHVRTHTGEKPFACQVCGKKFRQKAHLAKHHQTHTTKPGTEGQQATTTTTTTTTLLQLGVQDQEGIMEEDNSPESNSIIISA